MRTLDEALDLLEQRLIRLERVDDRVVREAVASGDQPLDRSPDSRGGIWTRQGI
jgi:hypothetical protein